MDTTPTPERQPRIVQINTTMGTANVLQITALAEDGQIAVGFRKPEGVVWVLANLPTFDPMVQP